MMEAWVIEKIKEQQKVVEDKPQIRCPVFDDDCPCIQEEKDVESTSEKRGVIVIPMG